MGGRNLFGLWGRRRDNLLLGLYHSLWLFLPPGRDLGSLDELILVLLLLLFSKTLLETFWEDIRLGRTRDLLFLGLAE
jgi:hypothetical protein